MLKALFHTDMAYYIAIIWAENVVCKLANMYIYNI